MIYTKDTEGILCVLTELEAVKCAIV